MNQCWSKATGNRKGTLFIDVLIGVAVFGIVVSGVIYAMLFSQQGMLKSGDRIRAVYLNQKAVAAVKAVRDDDFASLADGTYGASLDASGAWQLAGTGVTTADGYTTSVTLLSQASDRMLVSANTVWNFGAISSGSASLTTEIADWHQVQSIGDWTSVSLQGAYVDDGTPLFNAADADTSYAYVTSETSDGGAGLYLFDISTLSSPTRIAESFDLGNAGYDVLLNGTTLFVVTGDGSAEIHIYDVSSPATFSSDDLQASINVPGTGLARAIAYYDDTLYIASQEDSGESEFFAYDVSDLGSITLLDDLNDPGSSYTSVHLADGYAYLASSMDTMELRVVDVFNPSSLDFAGDGGYNLTDTPDGTAVIPVGDYLILGRNQGSVTEELHLFDVSETPVPADAPFNAEAGENVNALDAEPTATYAFAATNHDSQELVVLDIDTFASGGNPITETYNTSTGFGRGVLYSVQHDRVFLLTNTAFIILQPS